MDIPIKALANSLLRSRIERSGLLSNEHLCCIADMPTDGDAYAFNVPHTKGFHDVVMVMETIQSGPALGNRSDSRTEDEIPLFPKDLQCLLIGCAGEQSGVEISIRFEGAFCAACLCLLPKMLKALFNLRQFLCSCKFRGPPGKRNLNH